MKNTLDKGQVKTLYLEGFTTPEIARKLSAKKDTVKKCIQRNFGYLKHSHNMAAKRRKEVVRAVNYESNKYMGDSTFIKKNRSIYKTKPNGDIVLNKKVAPVVTWDTPRRLANENKDRF
ncbi:terminase gpP N-terminus-related DNA-binding protein [Clostridium tyrobutyricum]|uniref:terminase gpP N-terminus-related DNA-binding protein n=1 Tax=Clostridium tyrobutyricum TaxID=1519 RepID=UPI001C390A98|nr:DNA-binding response regulator [Clostridium tyrobutyricum]MBV4417456.1 DNA-binding response regulator [Clostridium tyrobutyricum]